MGLCLSCTKKPLPSVAKVDVPSMLGTWYVVGVIPTPFEKGAFNPTEVYTWNTTKSVIDVDFKFNQDRLDGPIKSVPQTIYTRGYPEATGKWLASPVWPVKLDYTIMDVADDYAWVVVGHQSRKWFWVMSRTTSLDEGIMSKAKQLGKDNGFDLAKMEFPQHNK